MLRNPKTTDYHLLDGQRDPVDVSPNANADAVAVAYPAAGQAVEMHSLGTALDLHHPEITRVLPHLDPEAGEEDDDLRNEVFKNTADIQCELVVHIPM